MDVAIRRLSRARELWPQGPLALGMVVIGTLNVVAGLSLPLSALQRIEVLQGLADSLSAVGGTAQVILGVLLVSSGIGLWWRLVSAWIISVLLLVIAVGINAVQSRWFPGVAFPAVMLALLLAAKRRFHRRTIIANYVYSASGVVAILAYGLFGSYLLGAGFRPAIHDFGTAFYFTIVTLSTVGYGDIVPVTPEARWFVVTFLVVGLGVFASAIASALGPKISGELNRLFKPKESPMELKDHVILVGEGGIARNTADELRRRKLSYVQIVSSPPKAGASTDFVLAGDPTSDAVLIEAGIRRARLIIAAREDDGENAFIVLGAKELNPGLRALAVASSGLSIRRLKLARADLVFSPIAVGSRLLADLVEGTPIPDEFKDLLEDTGKRGRDQAS